MKLGPFEISFRLKAAPPAAASSVSTWSSGWGLIREPFTGAWQAGIVQPDPVDDLLAFGPIFSCVSLISSDVGLMRPMLQQRNADRTWSEVLADTPATRLLRRPNSYQNWAQFLEEWTASRLLWGNTYCLKSRDARGVVESLHLLRPDRTRVLVTDDGGVYYRVVTDRLDGIDGPVVLRRSEVAHDRQHAFYHPLLGISTISAAAASGTFGRRIQQQSTIHFANLSRPGGHLTSDSEIDDVTAERLKRDFEAKFSGAALGRTLVTGSGLKFESMSVPAVDAQLVEQLKWTAEDCARVFKVPAYKVGAGQLPSFNNISQLTNDYLTQTLQPAITAIELALADALELPPSMRVELDVTALTRMDALSRAEVSAKLVGAGVMSPNEARLQENLAPVAGGEVPYLQQQNWQLAQLAARSAPTDAPAVKDFAERLERLERRTIQKETRT